MAVLRTVDLGVTVVDKGVFVTAMVVMGKGSCVSLALSSVDEGGVKADFSGAVGVPVPDVGMASSGVLNVFNAIEGVAMVPSVSPELGGALMIPFQCQWTLVVMELCLESCQHQKSSVS